jgi:beta-lactamase superfamily II metal-dependent hydrolase
MKGKLFIIILITLLIYSCDYYYREFETEVNIQNLSIIPNTNILTFTTIDSVYVKLFYINSEDSADHFKGWSTVERGINHRFTLPVRDSGIIYNLSIYISDTHEIKAIPDTIITFTSAIHLNQSFLKMHFINVQQGDAVLIQTPLGVNIMYDGGYGTMGPNTAWAGFRQPISLDYLVENNVFSIDYIIESHFHRDHWGGLHDIVTSDLIEFDQRNYIATPNDRRFFIDSLVEWDITPGNLLNLCTSVVFNVLSSNLNDNVNYQSIVLRVDHGNSRFLLAGDIGIEVEEFMRDRGFDYSVDVLLVPHHGSHTRGTANPHFLNEALKRFPKIAILSFGENNPYGHPVSIQRFYEFETFFTNNVCESHKRDNFHINTGTVVVFSDGYMVFISSENN